LMVKDLKLTENPIQDQRTTQLHQAMFAQAGTYVFFHQNVFRQLANQLPESATPVLFDGSAVAQLPAGSTVFVVDCPDATADLTTVLRQLQPAKVIVYLYKKESLSQLGMPTRAQYAKLFKFVATHRQVDVGHQLTQLATFLQIPRTQLIFMIQVFFECGFVTIDHGLMDGVAHPAHKDLTTAPSYQLRRQQMQTETELLACSTAALTKRLAPLI